jgi:hypothetical protein
VTELNPRLEVVHCARCETSLELELVDRQAGLAVPTRRYSRYAITTHLPHVDMMAEAVEVVDSVLFLFWPYSVSSCQAN